jgi:hypothetical protein
MNVFSELKLRIFVTLYSAIFLLSVFKRISEGDFDVSRYWLYKFDDKPWTPMGTNPIPIIGEHYFGDAQLPLMMLAKSNPFEQGIFNNILPLGYAPLGLFAINLNRITIMAFLLFMLLTFCYTYWILLSSHKKSSNFHYIPLGSIPLFYALDRGAPVILALSAAVLSLQILMKKDVSNFNKLLAITLIAYSLSAKIYFVVFFLIVWIAIPNIRKSIEYGFATTIVLNFILSYLFGGPQKVINQILGSLFAASGNNQIDIITSGSSISALCFHIIQMVVPHQFYLNLVQIPLITLTPGLVYLFFLIKFVLSKKGLPKEIILILALSSIQLVSPISFYYTTTWTIFAFAYFISYVHHPSKTSNNQVIHGLSAIKILFLVTFWPIPTMDWEKLVIFIQIICMSYFFFVNSTARRFHEN